MLIQQSADIGPLGAGVLLADPPGGRRAALYLSSVRDDAKPSSALIVCARQARRQGLRVVTLVAEDQSVCSGEQPRADLGGERLRNLVCRLEDGHFDIILAHMGDAMITIGASTPVRQGEQA